ncbi:MAG: cysteine desulfurase NifS [Pelotomaculaceae bacterium]|jgi:cysteine desulfurase|uniref:cysteine desulfurase n=1 Tax=anaerobic digester metagenome TaxID=1263854 RepID=A0A485M6C3_9ZZZZ|nr:cysteine desulfurase NifS [Bacillota bacterium]HHU86419.1 cysteine desulfurase NifS [Peptococcaceae bacterium]
MGKIYFDHSATTPVHPDVAEEMFRCVAGIFGNPSSIHSFGREAKKAVDAARSRVAESIGAKREEIVFTSGGTESDHLAIKGAAYANRKKGNHIITTAVEHHAVLNTCKALEKEGFELTVLPVDGYGMVNPGDLAGAIKDNTILITVMHANNEVGTIQPISEIGEIAREKGILFHTDAVQSIGKIPVDVNDLKVDLLSISGHKIYAPKGIGALYIKQGITWRPFNFGGGQERERRPGTENVPGIVALGKAVELAAGNLAEESARLTVLRDKLIKGITERIDHVKLAGHPSLRLPNNVNFVFEYIDGGTMLLNLDMHGVAASSGSACSTGSVNPSHVLLAMGIPRTMAHGSLRLTLGMVNKEKDVDEFIDIMPGIIEKLRSRV